MLGTRTTVSGPSGDYFFAALLPGRYDVKFELQGMLTVTRKTDLRLAETSSSAAWIGGRRRSFYGTGKAGGVANPGYITPPTSVTYWFSNRGEFRFEDVTATDLALNYNTNPSWLAGVGVFVQAELINALNEQANTFNTSILTASNDTTLQRFNPIAGDKPVEGVHWKKGPLFGLPTSASNAATTGSFQTPRTYRVSVGLKF